jgi:preprotein translocase subunit SecB
MSDTSQDAASTAAAEGVPLAPIAVKAQYIRDLSFENPSAPRSLQRLQEVPQVNINVNVDAKALEKRDWEVTLELKADAKRDDEMVFIIELVYAGVFEISEHIPDEGVRPLLLIECARLLFPFARDILSSATRDGGLPPLLLQPIDFVELYRRRFSDLPTPPAGNA